MSAVFLPWMILNLQLTGDHGKTTGVWAGEAAERIRFADINFKSWLIRPLQVAIDLLPWTPLLVVAWWRNRPLPATNAPSAEQERWDHVIRGTRWGLLAGLAVLLLLPHGTARYCQPLFPALFVLLVDHWGRLHEALRADLTRRWELSNRIFGWVAALVAGLMAALVPMYLGGGWVLGAVAASVALAVAFLPQICARRNIRPAPIIHTCIVMSTFAAAGLLHAGTYMDQKGDLRQNSRTMASLFPDPARPLIFYRTSYFRSLHYVRRPYEEIDSGSKLRPGPAYLVMHEKELTSKSIKALLRSHQATELARPTWEERKFVILQIDPATR
jgi:hypothetical protein